jgi:mercuric ion transport protein
MAHELETRRWGWGVLLVSVTTLVCCALPILLVSLGMGAIWATIYANFAAVGFVAENKLWFFSGCAGLLVLAAYALYRPGRTCPADPLLAAKCQSADRWNKGLLAAAGLIWLVGFAAAYLALPLAGFLGA